MVERSLSMREVRGSIPRISTQLPFSIFLTLGQKNAFDLFFFLSLPQNVFDKMLKRTDAAKSVRKGLTTECMIILKRVVIISI
jgi:hypothetical protein